MFAEDECEESQPHHDETTLRKPPGGRGLRDIEDSLVVHDRIIGGSDDPDPDPDLDPDLDRDPDPDPDPDPDLDLDLDRNSDPDRDLDP